MGLRIFPVATVLGVAAPHFWDDFGQPRSGGRSHEGNDIFAEHGAPLLAVDDGVVQFGENTLGGTTATLLATDKARYCHAHLSATQGVNRSVRAGDILGYVGNSGNAAGTPSHVHFEVHPGGGAAVDPFPLLQAAAHQTVVYTKPWTPLGLLTLGALGIATGYWVGRRVVLPRFRKSKLQETHA